MQAQIFFSYANAPGILTPLQLLVKAVNGASLRTWYDRGRLVPGKTFEAEIMRQIDASAAVVLLVTPATFGSSWVLRELNAAAAGRLPIVPCFLQPSFVPPEAAAVLATLNRLELFRYAQTDWEQALIWTLDQIGIEFPWPSHLSFVLPSMARDIDAIYPPYALLRQASRHDVDKMFARVLGGLERNGAWGYGHLNAGLIRLHLGDRDGALAAFRQAADYLPRVAEVFYCQALAVLAFTPLRRARPAPLIEAESALAVARRLDPARPLFAVLDGLISREHYVANGFRRPGGQHASSLAADIAAARRDPIYAGEVDRLAATIPVRDPALQAILAA